MNRLWWVIIGLAVVIVLMILFWPDEHYDSSAWKATVDKVNSQLADSSLRIQSLLKEKKADSIKHLQIQSTLISQANASKAEADRLKRNPIVIKVREEVPEIDSLIHVQDSVIQIQGNQIAELDSAYNKLQVNMDAVVSNFQEQIKLHEQKFAASQEMNKELEKQVKKERRKGKLARVLIPVVGIGAFLLGGL